MHIQESGEMYLESVFVLSQRGTPVRSVDVAEYLNYSKPSVSRAVGLLKQGGYLVMDKDGFLILTEEGIHIAKKIFERHNVLSRMLMGLGVSKESAVEDACKIEHVISDETFEAIKAHLDQYYVAK